MSFFNLKDGGTKPGVVTDPQNRHLADLQLKVNAVDLPEFVAQQVDSELGRLAKIDPIAAEFSIGMSYIDTILSLPWFARTKDNLDLERAQAILNQHHFGLQTVKTRVMEYLAVKTLRQKQQYRLLIVDDETVTRGNLLRFFGKLHYVVAEAGNGLEALERINQGQVFDLIITDLKMAGMDGLTLIDEVLKVAPDMDVIMITGYATLTTAIDAMRKGAIHYMAKPIQLDELQQTVATVLGKQHKLQMKEGPILCFSGAPGTGKTSICRAVADSLGRKFIRISMAGLRDEAEIRGHRRTYAGAMPGRIINEIKRAGVMNPCILLDEIDKIGQDFRGDPAAVLLEVLDPEQNKTFVDHYLDLPFDLSSVMFMATVNDLGQLPGPLVDRLEVIDFPSYSLREKKKIGQKYLMAKQLLATGLAHRKIEFTDSAMEGLIQHYTRESGVRSLNREINSVCRKIALESLTGEADSQTSIMIDEEMLLALLGPRKYQQEAAQGENHVGVVTGLVWTDFGGEIMFIEALLMRGTTNLILTGSLGEVLQESAQTALSYIRSHAAALGIAEDFYDQADIHIHLPAGAISKDGPSAGLAIALTLISLLTSRLAQRNVAVTGEMTLTGHILAVGGVREKVLAAARAGCRKVLLPRQNKEDILSLPADIAERIEIVLVSHLQDALPHLLIAPV